MSAAFSPGEAVRVARVHPPGHRRTPYYVRGKTGVVTEIAGEFRNPEELGYGFDGLPAKRLYRVRFQQSDLWPAYSGSATDTVVVDLYEHWLSRAG